MEILPLGIGSIKLIRTLYEIQNANNLVIHHFLMLYHIHSFNPYLHVIERLLV